MVHEPALLAVAPDSEAGAAEIEPAPEDARGAFPILELASRSPRAAMEAFVRKYTSDATFERLDPMLRERVLGNGAHFFAREIEAFASYVPDVWRLRGAGVPIRQQASRDGLAGDADRTAWLATQLDLPVELVSGHHAPYVQHPDMFAEELRPTLREIV
ncbi:MAG: hypothetical protein ACRDPC_15880 [Solirubrobacteraceae bacterium]